MGQVLKKWIKSFDLDLEIDLVHSQWSWSFWNDLYLWMLWSWSLVLWSWYFPTILIFSNCILIFDLYQNLGDLLQLCIVAMNLSIMCIYLFQIFHSLQISIWTIFNWRIVENILVLQEMDIRLVSVAHSWLMSKVKNNYVHLTSLIFCSQIQ